MTDKINIADSLLAGNFERRSPDAKSLSDPLVDTPMVLTLDELRPYEFNPRISRNPFYDEIKKSILNRGLDSPPSVTRRPGQEHFIIHNGGNTRLGILKELWSETKNEQFFRILCIFKPWKNEITALTGHLAENELHGSLSLLERALAIDKAKELYEDKAQAAISQNELSKLLSQDGYPISQPLISRMQDVVSILLPAIPVSLYGGLSDGIARKLLSLRQSARNFWIEHVSDEGINYDFSDIYQDVLSQFDTEPTHFDYERLQDELIDQISKLTVNNYDLVAMTILQGNKRKSTPEPVVTENPALQTVPSSSSADLQIPSDFVKPDLSDVLAEAENHSAKFIIKPKEPKSISEKDMGGEISSHLASPSSSDSDVALEQLIQGHTVSEMDTSDRVQSIQRMVSQHIGEEINDFRENVVKAIPVQAGGLYPISDVWFIEPAIDTPEYLRTHIEQLAVEIAADSGSQDKIEQADDGIGFRCSIDSSNSVLTLLASLSQNSVEKEQKSALLEFQLNYLLINGGDDYRIGDEALVKLYRLIRLARRLSDLTKQDSPM